jgi:hypothetical protein
VEAAPEAKDTSNRGFESCFFIGMSFKAPGKKGYLITV